MHRDCLHAMAVAGLSLLMSIPLTTQAQSAYSLPPRQSVRPALDPALHTFDAQLRRLRALPNGGAIIGSAITRGAPIAAAMRALRTSSGTTSSTSTGSTAIALSPAGSMTYASNGTSVQLMVVGALQPDRSMVLLKTAMPTDLPKEGAELVVTVPSAGWYMVEFDVVLLPAAQIWLDNSSIQVDTDQQQQEFSCRSNTLMAKENGVSSCLGLLQLQPGTTHITMQHGGDNMDFVGVWLSRAPGN